MNTKQLKDKILSLAIQGKLVPQDSSDEPSAELLERINPKYTLIENEELLPKGWCWCKINDIGKIVTGTTPPKDTKAYYDGDIPFFKPTDLEQGKHTCKSIDHLSELGFEKSRQLPPMSILVTCIGTIGKTGLITVEGSCNQQINAIIPHKDISPLYVYYTCISDFFQNKIKINAPAVTLPILKKNKFVELTIPLPPLAEQHRIVEKVESLFTLIDTIEKNKESIKENIKTTRQKLLSMAIRGELVPQDSNDEPASVLLDKIRKEKEQLIREGKLKKDKHEYIIYRGEDGKYYERIGKDIKCIDEDIPFEIPDNWKWTKLGSICVFLSRGKSPKYSEKREYPVFAQKCNLKDGWISLNEARFLDPSTLDKWQDEYKLRTGDVLINSTGTGTVCRTRLFDDNCLGPYPFVVPDSHVSVVRTYDDVNSSFIFYYLISECTQQYLTNHLAGSTNQKELYIGVLENLFIPLPPKIEQQRIVENLEFLFAQLDGLGKNT